MWYGDPRQARRAAKEARHAAKYVYKANRRAAKYAIRMLDGPIGIDMGDQGVVSLVYFFFCFSSSLYSHTYGHG